jgi:hypothetical protein
MNKTQLEKNLVEINDLYNNLQKSVHDLLEWVENKWRKRQILDDFLVFLWIEKNNETRYAAYSRIVWLKEEPLILYLEKSGFSEKNIFEKLDLSYNLVCDFHSEIQAVMISVIENKKLLTPFYLEIFKWVANVWLAFNDFFLPWRNHIVRWVNKDLEEKFDNNSEKIIDFLNTNKLFEKDSDRSYSALVLENNKYKIKSYSEVFEKQVKEIVVELDSFIIKLSSLEDEIYNSKDNYINYLRAIKNAFIEKNVDKLLDKWQEVDNTWMEIKTPFQIWHPLEFYEDKYRKAVAPEWDLRMQNTVFESDVADYIEKMYEVLYDEIGRDNYKSSYEFSLANQKRVQLYLTSPVLYYSSELTWLFSAQVVPNDEVISKAKWKKIFAFPEMVLENKRNAPFMKIDSNIFERNLLDNYRRTLFWDKKIFYKIYDIETIGHEFGHTLWLDLDTEVKMNSKTGVYKNIEEFKATTWWLVMYFLNENIALNLKEELLTDHIIRCISLLRYREVNEIEPYYCESLIHLSILFESWIIYVNDDNKIEFNFSEKTYKD